jgi:hypothetical protein
MSQAELGCPAVLKKPFGGLNIGWDTAYGDLHIDTRFSLNQLIQQTHR